MRKLNLQKTLLTIILFYCVILFSAIISSNEETASKFIRLYGYWIVIIIIATSLKKEYISAVITSFTRMFVSEIIAYGVFFELWEFGKATKENPSPFMMHIDYSIFLAFTLMLLFNRIISKIIVLKRNFL